MVAMSNQSCKLQLPRTNCVTRSLGKISTNVQIIIAKALASTSINSNPFTYAEAMDSPQQGDWKRVMEEECTSILLNNTFTTNNSPEERQVHVNPISSKLVDNTKNNPDGSIRYKVLLVIEDYEEKDFGETYDSVRKLTTFQYLNSLVAKRGWNIEHLDVVTACHHPEVHDVDIFMTLQERRPDGLNPPAIVVRLQTAR
jgi:hypothetical protein